MKIKQFRVLVLLTFIFIVSGCSVEYNLVINEDSSINEEIVASENTNRLEANTKLQSEQACTYLFNMFKRDNEDISFDYKDENSITIGTAKTIHTDIEEFSSKFSSDIFENVEVLKNDNVTTIIASQKSSLRSDDATSYVYDDITINITVPFAVTENNADKVSKNTYTWNIKKDASLKTIKLSYKDGELLNRASIEIDGKKYNFKYEYFVIAAIVLVIVGIIVSVFIKSRKNNVL